MEKKDLNKFFHDEILDQQYNLVESSIRHKYMVGIFSTSQTQRFGKNKKGNIIYFVKPIQYNLPNFLTCLLYSFSSIPSYGIC